MRRKEVEKIGKHRKPIMETETYESPIIILANDSSHLQHILV